MCLGPRGGVGGPAGAAVVCWGGFGAGAVRVACGVEAGVEVGGAGKVGESNLHQLSFEK